MFAIQRAPVNAENNKASRSLGFLLPFVSSVPVMNLLFPDSAIDLPGSPGCLYVISHFCPMFIFTPHSVMPLLVCGSIITPVDKHSYSARPNAYTYVNDDGIIEAILELTPGIEPSTQEFLRSIGYSGEIEVLRLAKGEFLIPGFIDTHIVRFLGRHSYATFANSSGIIS